jgi:hypothetical protein
MAGGEKLRLVSEGAGVTPDRTLKFGSVTDVEISPEGVATRTMPSRGSEEIGIVCSPMLLFGSKDPSSIR